MLRQNLELNKVVKTRHTPVLLNEVIENLNLKKGDVVLDGTVGGGGYLKEICKKVDVEGKVIGLDQDNNALERVKEGSKNWNRDLILVNDNFRNLDNVLIDLNIKKVNGVVFDLGLSSDHFENSGRGFSFKKDEPLLMTFEKDLTKARFTARDIVNDWDEENIADILYGYGEEKFSRRIAKNIVEARKEKAINTTTDLVEIIEKSVPVWYKKGRKTHFATKTFQALRITVNDELETLKDGLKKGFDALEKQGRLVVVSFHSLEDRIIKNFMRDKKNEREGILITKKPIVPSREEIKENPRSRSAKLRIIEKI